MHTFKSHIWITPCSSSVQSSYICTTFAKHLNKMSTFTTELYSHQIRFYWIFKLWRFSLILCKKNKIKKFHSCNFNHRDTVVHCGRSTKTQIINDSWHQWFRRVGTSIGIAKLQVFLASWVYSFWFVYFLSSHMIFPTAGSAAMQLDSICAPLLVFKWIYALELVFN